MFHLTLKNFSTPLGELSCDREFVSKLANLYGYERSFADEILHRAEHSLELQTPFLTRLEHRPSIVPILVGNFHHMITGDKRPQDFGEYESFVGALAECVGEKVQAGCKVYFLAGVDMAHVGRAFGDTGSLTPEFMKTIEERDLVYLKAIENQDKKALIDHIGEDGDGRRVCGFPTMYTLIDVCDRIGLKYKAKLFDYRQSIDYITDCAVTFAGIGLYI